MSRTSRKFVAVLMLLWLPLFTGSALAASVSMLLPHGGCHDAAMPHATMDMGGEAHHMHHGEMPVTGDGQGTSGHSCGVCHLACTGYLAVHVEIAAVQTPAREITPYLVAFNSVTTAPLVPPPLARA